MSDAHIEKFCDWASDQQISPGGPQTTPYNITSSASDLAGPQVSRGQGWPLNQSPGGGIPATSEPDPRNYADNADSDTGIESENDPFPVDCLSPTLAAITREAAEAEKTPESLAACCALAAVSAAVGAGLEVASGGDRRTRGNLFILAVAESGTGKSNVYGSVVGPYEELENAAIEAWKKDTFPGLRAAYGLAAQRKKRIEKELEKKTAQNAQADFLKELTAVEKELDSLKLQMQEPCWTVSNVTKEELAKLLFRAPNESLASLTADARGAADVLAGRYRDGKSTDEDIYLSAFTGESFKVDRRGSQPVNLKRPCLSLLWKLQPDKLKQLMSKEQLADSGLFQRALFCDTKAEPAYEPETPVSISAKSAKCWRQLLADLAQAYKDHEGARLVITAKSEALALMREYHNSFVSQRKVGGALHDVASYAARWGEQAWRLAVVLHAGEHGGRAHEEAVTEETAENAITIAKWFAKQQLLILSGGRRLRHTKLLQKVRAALAAYSDKSATLRNLERRHDISNEQVEEVARCFPDVVGIETHHPFGPGRPSKWARLLPVQTPKLSENHPIVPQPPIP
jgi:Protein of unknown function (DUF3987)